MLIFIAANGCAKTPCPMIKVAIGMTLDQLRVGSTYPFKAQPPSFQAVPGQKTPYQGAEPQQNWVITEPYDLIYIYKGKELTEEDLGGDNYLLDVNVGPGNPNVVDYIQVTFQNRALTLDEALAVAHRLDDWFIAAGFHPRSVADPESARIMEPFHVEEQEQSAPRYMRPITGYQEMRAAFLDPDAKIIELTPFELETSDAAASLHVVNARRRRGVNDAITNEVGASSEHEYFLDLYIVARPRHGQ